MSKHVPVLKNNLRTFFLKIRKLKYSTRNWNLRLSNVQNNKFGLHFLSGLPSLNSLTLQLYSYLKRSLDVTYSFAPLTPI